MKNHKCMPETFLSLVEAIVAGEAAFAMAMIECAPDLVTASAQAGAARASAAEFFFPAISHYMYAGDTALHMAAAAHRPEIAGVLLHRGSDNRAKNRRGAEPLHYAVDGVPGSPAWNPENQVATIKALLAAGADPNAPDKSGVTPFHRAIRNRCAAAVQALLDGGANLTLPNGKGSTPLQLATKATGKSGAGSPAAKVEQEEILRLLSALGAP